jgi:hypothetical protein
MENYEVAFGNEVAQTDDPVIVEATRTSAFPKNKQTDSWFVFGYPMGSVEGRSGFTLGVPF